VLISSGGGQIVLTGLPQGARHRPHSRQLFRAGLAAFEMGLNFSSQILVKGVIEVRQQPIIDVRMD
jgi:hypothetical protein